MIRQQIRYDEQYNITEYVERDSNGDIIYWEETFYHSAGGIKYIGTSAGHIRKYNQWGKLTHEEGNPNPCANIEWLQLEFLEHQHVAITLRMQQELLNRVRIPVEYFNVAT